MCCNAIDVMWIEVGALGCFCYSPEGYGKRRIRRGKKLVVKVKKSKK